MHQLVIKGKTLQEYILYYEKSNKNYLLRRIKMMTMIFVFLIFIFRI
jgi:hypothetical protein